MFGIMRSQTLSSLSLLSIALFLLPSTSALRIIVTPTTHTGAATTVYWIREPSDPQPLFDLRFVVQPEGTEGEADVGLAAANIPISVGSGDGEIRMGKEEVRFPKSGQYVLKAVAGPTFQVIGTSNEVVVSHPGTTPTSTPTGKSTETNETGFGGSQSNNPKSKTPLIVGATIGSILFLALVAFLLWFLLRRRRLAKERDRLSFRPEDMVSRRRSRPKWVSRLSLRVQARDENGPASAPAWGGSSFPATTTTNTVTENPFATPAGTPPGAQDREVSFAQPPPTSSAKNVLASVPPSRREMIAREMRSSSTSASMYSQESNMDVDVEAQTSESKSDANNKRRSGAWTLVEQALENVKRRASMVSRSSSVVESRVGTPLPVSASPYITSFVPSAIPASQAQSTSAIGTGPTSTPAPSTAAPAPRNMAERAGKRISILPPLPPSALPSTAQDTQSNVRGLPPVPLGPAFDAVSVLSASGSEGDDGSKGQAKEAKMSEKARGKQRSDSVVKKAKLETIPASPVSTVSGSVGHGPVPSIPASTSSTPSPPPPPPPPAVTEEKSVPEEHPKETKKISEEPVKEKRPLPTPVPVIHSPVPVVPPPPAPRSRPLPSPLVLKSATFTASNVGSSSTAGVARTATLAHPPNSASLRALPPLPPTPKTGAIPRSATVPTSAAPYTPSFPIPTVPSYPSLPPTPATGVPAVLTPALKEDGQPVSATVERTPSYTRDTVPPVLRTYTKRQRHIEHRIGQVKVQMRLLKRKIASSQVDSEVGSRVVADLSKQLAWLELHLYGDWALEVEGAQKPEGWGRYMRP